MLSVKNLVKTYDPAAVARLRSKGQQVDRRKPALGDVSLTVDDGQFHTLLGPSGCGKTTLLRSVAGLEDPDSGDIELSGVPMFSSSQEVNLSPDKRNLSMVFQSYAIWPHMTVRDNVGFPMKVAKPKRSKAEMESRIKAALASVDLGDYIDRSATKLSGGQQQRLAFARALVADPELLLLDEPLSNLDAQLRASMRIELKRLQRELGLTTLYVTHDQAEALAMSDLITVMSSGRVMQQGTPRDIYDRPANVFVAKFVGSPNVFDAEPADDSRRTVNTGVGQFALHDLIADEWNSLAVVLRPEDLEMRPAQGEPGRNDIAGTVVEQSFEGEAIRHIVDAGEHTVECRSTRHTDIRRGDPVHLHVEPRNVRALPADV